MPDEDSTETPLFGVPSHAAKPSTVVDEPVDNDEPESVQMHIAAPWRFSSFQTPALPGVTLTPEWQSYPRDVAETLYHEARRCGFTVSSSVDFSTEGGK
jgi:hypothetical protein